MLAAVGCPSLGPWVLVSLQTCHLLPASSIRTRRTMQGTSMATPLIAGSAVLVRQYFLSGAYPTGSPTTENAFAPSGALVKAVLIGGASGLSGYEPDTGLPLAPPPSFRQGFGRVHLSQSLPIQVNFVASRKETTCSGRLLWLSTQASPVPRSLDSGKEAGIVNCPVNVGTRNFPVQREIDVRWICDIGALLAGLWSWMVHANCRQGELDNWREPPLLPQQHRRPPGGDPGMARLPGHALGCQGARQ